MKKKDFENLKASLQEVIEIERGEREPSRRYTIEKGERKKMPSWLEGDPISFENPPIRAVFGRAFALVVILSILIYYNTKGKHG